MKDVIKISRYDKYDPISGGFRAPLAANFGYTAGKPDYAHADLSKVRCVSINTSGQVVIGYAGATTRFAGVMILTEPKAAGEIVDVMTSGEIVEFTLANGTATTAGTTYASAQSGDYAAAAVPVAANTSVIGSTVEGTRLIVRVNTAQVVGT